MAGLNHEPPSPRLWRSRVAKTSSYDREVRRGYRFRINSSTETPACLSMPDSVPGLISLWLGTTHPDAPRRKTMWLPFCRTVAKPILCRAERHSRLPMRGSLGMGDLESGHQSVGGIFQRKFFQIKLCCLFEIGQGFIYRFSLGRGPRFRIVGHVSTIWIRGQNGCKCHWKSVSEENRYRNTFAALARMWSGTTNRRHIKFWRSRGTKTRSCHEGHGEQEDGFACGDACAPVWNWNIARIGI